MSLAHRSRKCNCKIFSLHRYVQLDQNTYISIASNIPNRLSLTNGVVMPAKSRSRFISLVMATHFPQALTMIVLTTTLSFLFGNHSIGLIYVFIATAAGQASIGWVNDYVDSNTDTKNQRTHKPLVGDSLEKQDLRLPILIALLLSVPLSFLAAGWLGGLANIFAIISAQLYNLYLSRTIWSWLPYAVSFGLLMLFVTQSSSTNLWPSWQVVLIASCVGVIAHLFNALPDLQMDKASDLGGLVVWLGKPRAVLVITILSIVIIYLLLVR